MVKPLRLPLLPSFLSLSGSLSLSLFGVLLLSLNQVPAGDSGGRGALIVAVLTLLRCRRNGQQGKNKDRQGKVLQLLQQRPPRSVCLLTHLGTRIFSLSCGNAASAP